MPLELELPLRKIFEDRSLKPYVTKKQCATPAEGSLCYVWNEGQKGSELHKRLKYGKVFRPGGDCINNLIKLTPYVYDKCCERVIIIGPNTTTKTQTVRFIEGENLTKVIFTGWGSSFVVLWHGPTNYLNKYLKRYQGVKK